MEDTYQIFRVKAVGLRRGRMGTTHKVDLSGEYRLSTEEINETSKRMRLPTRLGVIWALRHHIADVNNHDSGRVYIQDHQLIDAI